MLTALVPMSCRDYFNDVDVTDVVSRTDLLPLPTTDLYYSEIDCRHLANRSMMMPNALRTYKCPTWQVE
jgi:hypothetical protein